MKSVSVGGHRYTDPDVLSFISSHGSPVDPRAEVLQKARDALQTMAAFGAVPKDPIERLSVLASICGIADLLPLTQEQAISEERDAFIVRTLNGTVVVYYNPFRTRARLAFSIAHEIAHTFIPNSNGGSQFRYSCTSTSREANELERLCDLAASELLMPQLAFRAEADRLGYELHSVPALMAAFGSSYEATTFRLASANPRRAAAGLLRFRLRKEEERRLHAVAQTSFFGDDLQSTPQPKYRRQSFHGSTSLPGDHLIRWNKSFDDTSVVYTIQSDDQILSNVESLPNGKRTLGLLQVTRAPFQRSDAHQQFPDLLFLWTAR